MAKTLTLVDNFNDNSFNTNLFGRDNDTQIKEQNSRLEIATALGGNYVAATSATTYDLTGSEAFVQIIDGGDVTESTVESYEGYPLMLNKDGDNAVFFMIGYSTIYAIKRVGGSNTNVVTAAYNSATQKWVRIREAGGTVYWEYSADAVKWTTLATETVANLFAITALSIAMQVGTWQAEEAVSTLILDNLNHYVTRKKTYNDGILY